MRVEKEKKKVDIVFHDQTLVKGFVYTNPGERILDFLNDEKENFIAVTNVEFFNVKEVHSFKLYGEFTKKRSTILLNKHSIKWMEVV